MVLRFLGLLFSMNFKIEQEKSFNIKKALFKFKGCSMSWLVSGVIYWKFRKLQSHHVNLITFIIHFNTDIILIDMQIRWHSKKINVKLCKKWCNLKVNLIFTLVLTFTSCVILGKLSSSIRGIKLINRHYVGKVHDILLST